MVTEIGQNWPENLEKQVDNKLSFLPSRPEKCWLICKPCNGINKHWIKAVFQAYTRGDFPWILVWSKMPTGQPATSPLDKVEKNAILVDI